MNPRKFCWGDPCDLFIATTYNFDPVFFERVVLRDVQSVCPGAIVVVADQSYLLNHAALWKNNLCKLGREYILTQAGGGFLFHPKLLLRLSRSEAKVWIGSNNLTSAGWYQNSELATIISSDKKTLHSSGIIPLLSTLTGYLKNQRALEALNDIIDHYTESETRIANTPLVLTPKDQRLADILAYRWKDRKFKKLKIYTGSTDEDGAFIDWCLKTFGIEECIVAANPKNVSFRKESIRKIPINLSFAPLDPIDGRLHAKCYFFENKNETAVVMGSANCSRAAWLIPPCEGGNVECITIYDEINQKPFNLLAEYPKEIVSAAKFLSGLNHSEQSSQRYDTSSVRVISVRISRLNAAIEIQLEGKCEEIENVTIEIGTDSIKCIPKDKNRKVWHAECIINTSDSFTAFCKIIIQPSRLTQSIITWWCDDIEELSHSFSQRKLMEVFTNLSNAKSPSELRRMLNDLYSIQDIIFNSSSEDTIDLPSLPSPVISLNNREKQNPESKEPITPEMLIRSLNESHAFSNLQHQWYAGGTYSILSLSGILRSIFASKNREEDDYDDSSGVGSRVPSAGNQSTNRQIEIEPNIDEWRIKLSGKLEGILEDFFERFSSPEFAATCSVFQFQQAIAFPLALIVVGSRSRWLDDKLALEWLIRLIDTLFIKEYDESNGMLHLVYDRYKKGGKDELFGSIIGDGTLWILSLLAIASTRPQDLASSILKAVMLRTVFEERTLIEKANSQKLSMLKGASTFEHTVNWLKDYGQELVRTLDKLESELQENKDRFIKNQRTHLRERDLVFHPTLGWGWYKGINDRLQMEVYFQCRAETRPFISSNYFICLDDAITKTLVVKNAIKDLKAMTQVLVKSIQN